MNINTEEIEEKDQAIKMLAVFIDELGGGYFEWVDQTSKIFIELISYEANSSIRNSVAEALPGLIKCIKEAQPQNFGLIQNVAKDYLENLWKAIKVEQDTETMIT